MKELSGIDQTPMDWPELPKLGVVALENHFCIYGFYPSNHY